VINDAAGRVLFSHQPQVLLDSEGHVNPYIGLVNYDAPLISGMKEVLLMINGQVQSRYVADDFDLPANAGMVLGDTGPIKPHWHKLLGPPDARRNGITYTVQAQPAAEA
jgi:hypothetical protein